MPIGLVFDVANPHQKLMDDIERYRDSSDSSLVESCHEELQALMALENRMIIQDPHRRFADRVFRALGQGLQQGRSLCRYQVAMCWQPPLRGARV